MLKDVAGFKHIYIRTGYTDLRKGIDGLAALVYGTGGIDPAEEGSIFLFCGRRNDRMKALLYEGDGWVLCYKRFADGRLMWPRNEAEVRDITAQQYRWLMEGLSIEQNISAYFWMTPFFLLITTMPNEASGSFASARKTGR